MFSYRAARPLAPQILIIGAVAAAISLLVVTAKLRIQANGQASGFGFLENSTGWGLSFSAIPTTSSDSYGYFFFVGLLNTIVLGAISLTLATILGLLIGAIRTSTNAASKLVGTAYVEVFRNVPLLLQIVFWYKLMLVMPGPRQALSIFNTVFVTNRGTYITGLNIDGLATMSVVAVIVVGLVLSGTIIWSRQHLATPRAKQFALLGLWLAIAASAFVFVQLGRQNTSGLINQPVLRGMNFTGGIRITPEFLACIVGIAVYGSAYIAEIIRAGFNAVDVGVSDAGKALGLTDLALLFLVRLPLAIRAILPALTNQYIWLMKATTVGIAIGFSDFFFVVATAINQSGQTFEIIGIFMGTFLALNYVLAWTLNRINAVIAIKGDQIRTGRNVRSGTNIIPLTMDELRRGYFGSAGNIALTLAFGGLFVLVAARILDWAILNAAWDPADPAACRAPGVGACWAVIGARWRLIFFGLYPVDEQWRSALACLALLVVALLTCTPHFWTARRIAVLWIGGFSTFVVLIMGGVFGLAYVPSQNWGGLALTLFIFAAVVVTGMPMAIVLALLRRSDLKLLSPLTGLLIDTIRALPLIALLYSAAVILPLALPNWMQIEKLFRVIAFFALFFACYQAEVLRGGFQSVSKGQEEAAKALGLKYRDRVLRVLLPQVFRYSLPTTINQLVVTFKETSLVTIVGFFEIMASGSSAFGTPAWSIAYVEVYVFIGLIYFIFVFSLSRYGAHLERRVSPT